MGADYALYVKAIFWVYFSALASVLPLHLAHVCMYLEHEEDHRFVYCYANYLWSKEFDIVISINQNKWTWTAMPTQQMK